MNGPGGAREGFMRITAAFLVLLCALAWPRPGLAQDKLGKVTFPISCDAKVQSQFERGVAMLHSYWFTESRKVFDAIVQQDPSCAMGYWGLAVTSLGNSLAAPPALKDAGAAWAVLEKARAVRAKSQRERDWIEAIGAYYRDYETVPLNTRLAAYTRAMEEMTQRYPDDFEAWTYYALTLQASASKNDKTYASQLKSAEILERLFKQNPDHPGVAHYLVHAYDYPPLADKGIRVAAIYARIAPAAPHARHMPSHIYSMVGMWEESPRTGRRSRSSRTTTTRRTSWCTRTCSSVRTCEPRRSSMPSPRCPGRTLPASPASPPSRRSPRATCSSAATGPAPPGCG